MIVLLAVDDRGGMLFHHRRQSQDRVLREKIITMTEGGRLWMNAYSYKQFAGDVSLADRLGGICVEEEFMEKAGEGEYAFAEDVCVSDYEPKIERIVLFHWNRAYPGDFFFTVDLQNGSWQLTGTKDFAGYSHERITMEVYDRLPSGKQEA